MRFRGNVIQLLGLRNRTFSFSLILIGKTVEAQDRLLQTILCFLLFHLVGNILMIRTVKKVRLSFPEFTFPPVEPIFSFCVWKIEKSERIVL